jgi:hypothetical protein
MGHSPSGGGTTRRPSRSRATALACLAALTTLLLLAPTARANTAIPDSGYVTNGEVKAIAHVGSITYIGGAFTEVGPATGPGVAINSEGAESGGDKGWARIWGSGGSISAVASDGSGGYYIGGSFSEVAGHAAENLAHIKSNGEVDTGWLPKANNTVNALAVSGEIVYAGGIFTVIGTNSAARNRIAALKASGAGEATSWNPKASNTVNALAVSGTSVVYVGGTFTEIGSTVVTRNRLAAIKTNAEATAPAEATSWNPNANNTVNALAVSSSGSRLYIGGVFTSLGTGDRAYYASFTFGGPTALFSVSAGPYTAGVTTVTFTNESTDATSSITSYEWAFGDSGTATTASPTHEYSAPCSPCTITLKVTDAEGLSAEVSHTITVAEGTLTFFTTSPTLPVLPSVVLNGEPQTTTTTMSNFTVDDARGGAGAGWNVTVASLATVGSTVSETFKEYCNSASPCGGNPAERYVSGGRELPANSLTLKKTAASFTALPGGAGSAPALECATECHVDHSTAEKVATAAAGAGKGGWQTTGFSAVSLSLATPMNLYVLPNANEVYRVDIVWTLNSGP